MKFNLFMIIYIITNIVFAQSDTDYGMQIFKKGNCKSCHLWHGDGGNSYGGSAMSIRETGLDKEALVKIIECGRPGTNMPYFSKMAYKDERCFGLKFKDFEGDQNNRPLPARKKLNDRQINSLVEFILTNLKGKKITKEYCIKYFGKPTKTCENF